MVARLLDVREVETSHAGAWGGADLDVFDVRQRTRCDVMGVHHVSGGFSTMYLPDVRITSLAARARRMALCAQPWAAVATRNEYGEVVWRRWLCGAPMCPVCMAHRAAEYAEDQGVRWDAFGSAGFGLGMLTLSASPVLTLDGAHMPVRVEPEEAGRLSRRARLSGCSVPGQPLASVEADFSSSLARWWRAARRAGDVVGAVRAVELTQVSPPGRHVDYRGRPALRWHVHAHILVVLRPGALEPRRAGERWKGDAGGHVVGGLIQSWLYHAPTRALPGSQHAHALTCAADARQVTKYLVKPGSMTRTGAIEASLWSTGRHQRQALGALHATARSAWATHGYPSDVHREAVAVIEAADAARGAESDDLEAELPPEWVGYVEVDGMFRPASARRCAARGAAERVVVWVRPAPVAEVVRTTGREYESWSAVPALTRAMVDRLVSLGLADVAVGAPVPTLADLPTVLGGDEDG
jgi:hypothetical protein